MQMLAVENFSMRAQPSLDIMSNSHWREALTMQCVANHLTRVHALASENSYWCDTPPIWRVGRPSGVGQLSLDTRASMLESNCEHDQCGWGPDG